MMSGTRFVSKFAILWAALICLSWFQFLDCYNLTNAAGYPICAENVYYDNGLLDIDSTLYNCSSRIPGSMLIPSFVARPIDGTFPATNVTMGVMINNLITVNDITSEVKLGFFLHLSWLDQRWYMPALFEAVSPQVYNEGVDITAYIRSQDVLKMWLPDIVFFEATDVNTLVESIRLYPDGKILWSRDMVTTIQESQNLIKDYPNDKQNFSLTFQSFAYDNNYLNLQFMNDPVTFRFNTEYHKDSVDLNQLWNFVDFSSFVTDIKSPSISNPNRKFSMAYVNLKFKRQSFGVVLRLALPISMFMMIVGFSFWSDIEKRLEISVQMLLIVTALYLIIGGVIPFIGYLTTMDKFITCVFVLLSLIIGVHVLCLRLEGNSAKHPMASFYQKCIVVFFKVVWIPCTIAVFQFFFGLNQPLVWFTFYSAVIACGVQVPLHVGMLEHSFKNCLIKLRKLEEDIIRKQNQKNSGKMMGHEAHLIQKLTRTEKLMLYISRPFYKTPHQLAMESITKFHYEMQGSFEDRYPTKTSDQGPVPERVASHDSVPTRVASYNGSVPTRVASYDGFLTTGASIHGRHIQAKDAESGSALEESHDYGFQDHREISTRVPTMDWRRESGKSSPTAASSNNGIGSSNGISMKGGPKAPSYRGRGYGGGVNSGEYQVTVGGEAYEASDFGGSRRG